MTKPPTVFIVDDDAAMRKSTQLLVESAGLPCQPFESATTFLDEYQPDYPGCLILDLHMPGMNGLELLERLRDQNVKLPVVIVSGTGTVPTAVRGMKLGIEDFLEKPVLPDLLIQRVKQALARDQELRAESASVEPIRSRYATLTPRERELLKHVVEGLPNKLIAVQMDISIKTVENHRARLMTKMGALNTADLVRMLMLIQPQDGKTSAP